MGVKVGELGVFDRSLYFVQDVQCSVEFDVARWTHSSVHEVGCQRVGGWDERRRKPFHLDVAVTMVGKTWRKHVALLLVANQDYPVGLIRAVDCTPGARAFVGFFTLAPRHVSRTVGV